MVEKFIRDNLKEIQKTAKSFSSSLGEDLAQETIIYFLENSHKPGVRKSIEQGNGMKYMCTMMRNSIRNPKSQFNKKYKTKELGLTIDLANENVDHHRKMELRELDKFISTLPVAHQILWNYYSRGKNISKLAREIHENRVFLSQLIHEIKNEIRQHLRKKGFKGIIRPTTEDM